MHMYVHIYIYTYICVCTTWTDVKLLRWLHFTFQEFPFLICRGHRPIVDTCANEAIPQWGKRRLITSVYLHFWPSWQGAKPRTPTNRFFSFLHGCRNLKSSFTSFLNYVYIVFVWIWRRAKPRTLLRLLSMSSFYLMVFMIAIVFSEYLPIPPTGRLMLLGLLFSRLIYLICML